jgi:hypothetical protein
VFAIIKPLGDNMRFVLENTVIDLLQTDFVLMGVILAAIGFAFALLARRIARAVRGTNEIAPSDPVLLVFKAFGLVCIIVALVLIVVAIN